MCFIGHGVFGVITKQAWCNYFAVFGIHESLAYQLMPWVGTVDIFLGVIFLFYPLRAIAIWMVGWALFTALLRPLSGEPVAEFVERAGNFGTPFVLLLTTESFPNNLFKKIESVPPIDQKKLSSVVLGLRVAGFMLLVAHGWLNLFGKKALLLQYNLLGFSDPQSVSLVIGTLEVLSAFFILLKPYREIVFVIVIWKIVSEMFYQSYGLVEWIERGGSYGILLAVWITVDRLGKRTIGKTQMAQRQS